MPRQDMGQILFPLRARSCLVCWQVSRPAPSMSLDISGIFLCNHCWKYVKSWSRDWLFACSGSIVISANCNVIAYFSFLMSHFVFRATRVKNVSQLCSPSPLPQYVKSAFFFFKTWNLNLECPLGQTCKSMTNWSLLRDASWIQIVSVVNRLITSL